MTASEDNRSSAATSPTRAGASSGSRKMAHSPHKNWRGCPMCKPHKRGWEDKKTVRDIRAAIQHEQDLKEYYRSSRA